MARNKVPKRITILAEDDLAETPELRELAEKGHVVVSFTEHEEERGKEYVPLGEYDLILSRSACAYAPGLEKWILDAVKGARARRYGNKTALEA